MVRNFRVPLRVCITNVGRLKSMRALPAMPKLVCEGFAKRSTRECKGMIVAVDVGCEVVWVRGVIWA